MTSIDPWFAFVRLIDAFEVTLRNSLPHETGSAEKAQITYITNRLGPGSYIASMVQGSNDVQSLEVDVMSDTYNTSGQVGAVGRSAEAHHMTFKQAWTQLSETIDLPALKQELAKLRLALRSEASDVEHDLAIAEVANAEVAAGNGDGSTVLEHLRRAGKWALSVATAIGL